MQRSRESQKKLRVPTLPPSPFSPGTLLRVEIDARPRWDPHFTQPRSGPGAASFTARPIVTLPSGRGLQKEP